MTSNSNSSELTSDPLYSSLSHLLTSLPPVSPHHSSLNALTQSPFQGGPSPSSPILNNVIHTCNAQGGGGKGGAMNPVLLLRSLVDRPSEVVALLVEVGRGVGKEWRLQRGGVAGADKRDLKGVLENILRGLKFWLQGIDPSDGSDRKVSDAERLLLLPLLPILRDFLSMTNMSVVVKRRIFDVYYSAMSGSEEMHFQLSNNAALGPSLLKDLLAKEVTDSTLTQRLLETIFQLASYVKRTAPSQVDVFIANVFKKMGKDMEGKFRNWFQKGAGVFDDRGIPDLLNSISTMDDSNFQLFPLTSLSLSTNPPLTFKGLDHPDLQLSVNERSISSILLRPSLYTFSSSSLVNANSSSPQDEEEVQAVLEIPLTAIEKVFGDGTLLIKKAAAWSIKLDSVSVNWDGSDGEEITEMLLKIGVKDRDRGRWEKMIKERDVPFVKKAYTSPIVVLKKQNVSFNVSNKSASYSASTATKTGQASKSTKNKEPMQAPVVKQNKEKEGGSVTVPNSPSPKRPRPSPSAKSPHVSSADSPSKFKSNQPVLGPQHTTSTSKKKVLVVPSWLEPEAHGIVISNSRSKDVGKKELTKGEGEKSTGAQIGARRRSESSNSTLSHIDSPSQGQAKEVSMPEKVGSGGKRGRDDLAAEEEGAQKKRVKESFAALPLPYSPLQEKRDEFQPAPLLISAREAAPDKVLEKDDTWMDRGDEEGAGEDEDESAALAMLSKLSKKQLRALKEKWGGVVRTGTEWGLDGMGDNDESVGAANDDFVEGTEEDVFVHDVDRRGGKERESEKEKEMMKKKEKNNEKEAKVHFKLAPTPRKSAASTTAQPPYPKPQSGSNAALQSQTQFSDHLSINRTKPSGVSTFGDVEFAEVADLMDELTNVVLNNLKAKKERKVQAMSEGCFALERFAKSQVADLLQDSAVIVKDGKLTFDWKADYKKLSDLVATYRRNAQRSSS
ncbi:hypothetical protein T439DRAFT_377664 [Meredithblackwellia eburnea MCA 4105]